MLHYYRLIRYKTTFGSASIQLAAVMQICLQFYLRTTVLEKLVYILVTMNETSILHLAGGKVPLQARRAVNQSKKPANGKFVVQRQPRFFDYILFKFKICN
jgi:hypothetical protein